MSKSFIKRLAVIKDNEHLKNAIGVGYGLLDINHGVVISHSHHQRSFLAINLSTHEVYDFYNLDTIFNHIKDDEIVVKIFRKQKNNFIISNFKIKIVNTPNFIIYESN